MNEKPINSRKKCPQCGSKLIGDPTYAPSSVGGRALLEDVKYRCPKCQEPLFAGFTTKPEPSHWAAH